MLTMISSITGSPAVDAHRKYALLLWSPVWSSTAIKSPTYNFALSGRSAQSHTRMFQRYTLSTTHVLLVLMNRSLHLDIQELPDR
jgi:hypothetical protein